MVVVVVDGTVVDAVVVEIGSVEGETDVVGAVVIVDDVDAGCIGITAVVVVG